MTDISSKHLIVTPNKVEVSGLNHVYIIPEKNGDVTIIGGQYKPSSSRDRRSANQGLGPDLVNDGQAKLTDRFIKTITPKKGQALSIRGVEGEVDNIRLQNEDGYKLGFSSIEINGQGGGLYGGLSTNDKNAGDNISLDLTDETPVTVHSHDEGVQGWKMGLTRDVVAITSSEAGSKLKIVPEDQVKVKTGLFSSTTVPSRPLLTNKARGPRTLDEMSTAIKNPSINNFTETSHDDGSYTLNFTD